MTKIRYQFCLKGVLFHALDTWLVYRFLSSVQQFDKQLHIFAYIKQFYKQLHVAYRKKRVRFLDSSINFNDRTQNFRCALILKDVGARHRARSQPVTQRPFSQSHSRLHFYIGHLLHTHQQYIGMWNILLILLFPWGLCLTYNRKLFSYCHLSSNV